MLISALVVEKATPTVEVVFLFHRITLLLENTYSILEPNKLRIHKLSALEHNGVYTCKGENEAGTSSVTTSFVLSVAGTGVAIPYIFVPLKVFKKRRATLLPQKWDVVCGFSCI